MKIAERERREESTGSRRHSEGRARRGERAQLSNSQQCENHEFDNSGPDLARRGQVPNELGVGKVSSAFKLCGHF